MSTVKIVFVGGTYRAKKTFEELLKRMDIRIVYAVFMPGDATEKKFAEQLAELAETVNVPCRVSDKINDEIISIVEKLHPDLILGGGIWRSIIPARFFATARYGYIGLHGTALPEYRGMAGINWQIINGYDALRMRIYQLGNGIDDGPLIADKNGKLLEYRIPLDNDWHLSEIFEEYDKVHIQACNDLIDLIIAGNINFIEQDDKKATYTCHRSPEDAEISWNKNSREIFNLIRSQSHPYSGAFTFYNGHKVTIMRARISEKMQNYAGRIPGKIVERNQGTGTVTILTSDSGIEILEAISAESTDPYRIFSSIKVRCKSRVEAICDLMNEKFNLKL